jgi:UDP-N-acetylenolpyruvoylglucosamine reductase
MTPENMMKTLRLTYRISNLPRETQKIIVSALVDINFGGCKHDALEKMKQELKELELDG